MKIFNYTPGLLEILNFNVKFTWKIRDFFDLDICTHNKTTESEKRYFETSSNVAVELCYSQYNVSNRFHDTWTNRYKVFTIHFICFFSKIFLCIFHSISNCVVNFICVHSTGHFLEAQFVITGRIWATSCDHKLYTSRNYDTFSLVECPKWICTTWMRDLCFKNLFRYFDRKIFEKQEACRRKDEDHFRSCRS